MDVDMDSLSKLEEMLKTVDGDKTPSTKELLEMLEQSEMEEEMKENLRAMLSGNVPQLFGGYGSGTYLGIMFVLIIFAVLYEYKVEPMNIANSTSDLFLNVEKCLRMSTLWARVVMSGLYRVKPHDDLLPYIRNTGTLSHSTEHMLRWR